MEQYLLEQIQGGNHAAYEQVFRSYYERLCNYAHQLMQDQDEAEEMVQEVFVKIWDKRENLVVNFSLKSYLYKAVYNTCLNRLKQMKNSKASMVENLPQSISDNGNIMIRELEKNIGQAIEKLPEQCRIIFKLSRFEELKYAEIAEHLNLSVKTVENQMGKALRVLRQELKDYLPFLLVILHYINQAS